MLKVFLVWSQGGEAVVYHVRAADEAATWHDYAMKVELPGVDGRYINNQINEVSGLSISFEESGTC